MIIGYLLSHGHIKRFLMVVPNTNLIVQAVEDFNAYGADRIGMRYQMVHGGSEEPRIEANVVIGTFQSLAKKEQDFLESFDAVCVDEAHTAATMSIKKIIANCMGSQWRFGLSGTLIGEGFADYFTIQANLGPLTMKISPDFLFQNKFATPVDIKIVKMKYLSDETRKRLHDLKMARHDLDHIKLYNIERALVTGSQTRLNFICGFISKVTKNSLVLFQSVQEAYGKQIYDKLREIHHDKEIFYIDGNTSADLREEYKDRLRTGNNRILIASFGTFSTGISINNLHSIFLVESYKSETIIKQSIGRMMRLHDDKEVANIVDFVDDFSWKGKPNYLLKHSIERMEIYDRENFPYKVYEVDLNKEE